MPGRKQVHMVHKKYPGLPESRRAFLQTLGAAAVVAGSLPGASPFPEQPDDYPRLELLRATHERQGIIPPEKTYRMMEWSLHFPPQGKFDFNLEGAMKMTREVGTESVLFYAQDHWG